MKFKLTRPFYKVLFCRHAEQVFRRCGIFGSLNSSHALVEDVFQALQAFFLRVACLDLEIGVVTGQRGNSNNAAGHKRHRQQNIERSFHNSRFVYHKLT